MGEKAERLRMEPETLHHSIGILDGYLSQDPVMMLETPSSFEQKVQLVAMVSLMMSCKYLEQTYPGIHKLNQIV